MAFRVAHYATPEWSATFHVCGDSVMESGSLSRREFLQLSSAAVVAAFAVPHGLDAAEPSPGFVPVAIPAWVRSVTRMAFVTPGEIDRAAELGVQVCHGNAVWPYFPLRCAGGGLSPNDQALLRQIVDRCHQHGMKYCLGLPPFPSVACMQAHPEWRILPDRGAGPFREPREDDLGTRLACNNGPWGDYLIDVCAELVEDFGLDGFSFDGNYHPALCHCPACTTAYRQERDLPIPEQANLEDVSYRRYLDWRGECLERHYARMQQRLKHVHPDTVLMSWTVNAGRYGHFLHSPRAMPTRVNQLFDLPMQEWWLDETNFGASVAPAFGAAYSRAVAGDRPAASEAYLMSRGNPYGTDSFPAHERVTRSLLALTNGSVSAESLGWPGHQRSIEQVFEAIRQREPYLARTSPWKWAALLVSEQTRQFYAYRDIADRFLPHVFGPFRMGMEEHLPVTPINDWDLTTPGLPQSLDGFRVLILPSSAALSDAQIAAIRTFVQSGGGLVATGEASLCDELGQPRRDFGLADLFGASYRGRPAATVTPAPLDANFAIAIDESYWQQRVGAARLTWPQHPLWSDPVLEALVPGHAATFKGPQVLVDVQNAQDVVAQMTPISGPQSPIPAILARKFGAGRVAYLPACLDAALWSYAYPYQRRMLARLVTWAAGTAPPLQIDAPKCVQTTFWSQAPVPGQTPAHIVQFFNGLNTTANHGLPATDVPLREETIPISGIRVHLGELAGRALVVEPGHHVPRFVDDARTIVEMPPLELHQMLILT